MYSPPDGLGLAFPSGASESSPTEVFLHSLRDERWRFGLKGASLCEEPEEAIFLFPERTAFFLFLLVLTYPKQM